MSRWWSDRLRVVICPDKLILLRETRNHQVVEKDLIAISQQPDLTEQWEIATAMLGETLHRPAWTQSEATVVVSHAWNRYLLIPCPNNIRKSDELKAYAKFRFTSIYGALANGWMIKFCKVNAGDSIIASAIDAPFIQSLLAVFSQSKIRLASVQPYLMFVFNAWRKQLRGKSCWFVSEESGHLCLSLLINGEWQLLRAMNSREIETENLYQVIEREILLAGLTHTPDRILIHAPERIGLASHRWPTDLTVSILSPKVTPAIKSGEIRAFGLAADRNN